MSADIKQSVLGTVETLETLEIINDAIVMNGENYPVTVDRCTELLQNHFEEGRISEDELTAALRELEFSPELLEGEGDVFSNYLEGVLDVEVHGKRVQGEWEITHVKVWVSLGGPNVWLVSDLAGDSVQVFGNWAGDTFETFAYAPGIVSYLQAYLDN